MTVEQGQAVLEHMKKFKVKPMIDKDYYMYVNNVFDNEIQFKGAPFDPDYLQEHYKEIMEPFKDTLNCMFTGPFYFEFTAKGIRYCTYFYVYKK